MKIWLPKDDCLFYLGFLVSLSKEDVENVPELPNKSHPKLGYVCNGHCAVRKKPICSEDSA